MTSTYQNYSSQYSPNLQEHVLFSSPNVYHDAQTYHSSSPSLSTRDFFSSINDHHQSFSGSYYNKELQQPHIQVDQVNDDFASNGGSCDYQLVENESSDDGLKFSIWKKEEHTSGYNNDQKSSSKYQVKWISSEMRLMHNKMNKTDPTDVNALMSTTSLKHEDQKQPSSDPLETDNTSNNTTSSNTMISNINHPIRVCSDCNTTKTPLWRSGPQGPKSLCNACGIRQRKARRAMAAAAAANGTTTRTETKPTSVLIKKTKIPQKDKTKKSGILKGSSSVVSKFKKQGNKMAVTSYHHQDKKKLCLEDFFLSLSKNLAFYTVFPQDEKEAAILLMALSFGHAHG